MSARYWGVEKKETPDTGHEDMQNVLTDIVIPHFNGLKVLKTCVSSLRRQSESRFQIIVVDNGSTDESPAWLRQQADIKSIFLAENSGFAAAVNLGIRQGSAPFIFLLNNDTELEEKTLARLLATAEKRVEFVFFAPKMLSYHYRSILDGAGDAYLRGGAGYRLGTMEPDSEQYNRPGPVFGGCAGATLYRRSLFDRVGLFDEDFFAYCEDVDLNLRLNRAGLKGYYVPEARVYHVGSATSGSKINAFTVELSTRNSLYLLAKQYPLALVVRLLPVIAIYQFFWMLFCVKKKQLPAYLRGMRGALGNLRGMRRKYRQLRHLDQVRLEEFSDCLRKAEREAVDSIIRRCENEGKNSRLLHLYTWLFLT